MLGYIALELDLKSVRLQQYKEIFISSVMMLFCIGIALIFWLALNARCNRSDSQHGEYRRPHPSRATRQPGGRIYARRAGYAENGINSMAMSLAAYHEEMQPSTSTKGRPIWRETLEQMDQNAS